MRFLFFLIFSISIYASEIFIAAASNLTYVMPEIVKEFNKKYPDVKVKFILSSSGKLTAQILKGAPYDIFLSADMKYPSFLYSKGKGIYKPRIYAKGKIILISFNEMPSLKKLENKTIAISKPQTTPYGKAAVEVFKNLGIYNKIKNHLVYAQSVASVLSYVRSGADVGVVNKSLIYSNKIKRLNFYYKDINSSLYSPINQGILLLSHKNSAKEFYNFLLSKDAKRIFKKFGYE